jgi:cell division septation protein DedD
VVEEQQFEQELGTALEDLPAVVSDDRPYVIRVSAYPLDSPRAKPMLHRLREHVTGSFLLPFKRGDQPLLRLFVGRFSDWDRALEEGRRLKQMQLIEDFAIQRLPFVIDWGGYNDQQAEQVQRQLEDDGIAAYLQKDAQGDLRILAGTFAEAQEAQAYLASLSYDRTPVVSR